MIPALLALTLAVVASPTPAPSAHASTGRGYVARAGCPASAMGFYKFTPRVKTAWGGILVENRESYSGAGYGGMYKDGALHYWRAEPGRPRLAAVAAVDPETHGLHAIVGTVRKVGDVWCMFSMPEPIPAKFLRDPG